MNGGSDFSTGNDNAANAMPMQGDNFMNGGSIISDAAPLLSSIPPPILFKQDGGSSQKKEEKKEETTGSSSIWDLGKMLIKKVGGS